jgi:PAS domain S-box-containing protein
MFLTLKNQKTIEDNLANINALIDNTTDLIWSIDSHFRYIAFNESFKNLVVLLSGFYPKIGERSQILKEKHQSLFDIVTENYLKAFEGVKISFEHEVIISGKIHFYSLSFSPIVLENSEIIGVTCFAQDITSRKEKENSEKKLLENTQKLNKRLSLLSDIINNTDEAFQVATEDGKCVYINKKARELTGVQIENIEDYFVWDFQKEYENHDNWFKQVEFIKANGVSIQNIEKFNTTLNKIIYLEFTAKFIELNNVGYIIAIAKDITLKKEQELELIKAKELAESLALAKDNFMASMSHEIRTPLNGILGFTKLLIDDSSLNSIQKLQLNAIKTSGDILLVIINDILDLAKIESGKMSLEQTEINLLNLINQNIGSFDVKIEEKGFDIKLNVDKSTPRVILGDPVRLSQILLNILSNAIKFTPSKGQIEISISASNFNHNFCDLNIQIKDSGIGIPADKIDLIFEPFVQTSDDTARKYGGTGLGLSIVRKIIELMNGEISVNSELGSGTTFNIKIPTQHIEKTIEDIEPVSRTENGSTQNNLKILLAEDNPINQLLSKTVLDQFGYQVFISENGKEAVKAVEEKDFDLILMDLMMPEMDGYEATKIIRNLENPLKSNIPIIALSADVTQNVIEKCKEIGMNNYLSKPFDVNQLREMIENYFKS